MDSSSELVQDLGRVTLCVITSRDVALSEVALLRSAQALPFGRVVFFSPHSPSHEDLEHVRIEKFESVMDYSRFVLFELHKHIGTDFVLIIHFDGFVVDPQRWDSRFLQYDYIGARWPGYLDHQVGNGGFTLRSLRLLKATATPRFDNPSIPEDTLICRNERDYLESEFGFRFAPPDIADRFSMEHAGLPRESFGFHGLFHMHRVYDDSELDDVLALMDPSVYCGAPAILWFLKMAEQGGHRILPRIASAILDAQTPEILTKNCGVFGIPPLDVALALGRVARGV